VSERLIAADRATIAAAIRGTTFVTETADALVPHRLPEWTRAQAADPFVHRFADQSTGVFLDIETAADVVVLDVRIDRFLSHLHTPDDRRAIFATSIEGQEIDRAVLTDGTVTTHRPDGTLTSTGGGILRVRLRTGAASEGSRIRIWMPHAAAVELVGVAATAELRAAEPDGRTRWIHHGSSISHCFEADGPLGTWPTIASLGLGWDLTNLGFSGQAMLDPFVARTIRDLPADVITLKIGINIASADTMRERTFVPAVHGFLDTIRDGHPETPIVLISPIHSTLNEAHDAPRQAAAGALDLPLVRRLLERAVSGRADARLHYLDGRALLGPEDAERLHDGLHPDPQGYRLIGERFAAIARRAPWPGS